MKPQFNPGKNIAIKVPAHQHEATVAFYRDVLGFAELEVGCMGSVAFDFGGKTLWVDRVETLSQAEVWLEIQSDDADAASTWLAEQGCTRCDGIEALPEDFKGFWVSSPANIIHLFSSS